MDFVDKVKELEVPPANKLVSYDVSALFTSIPVLKSLEVIKRDYARIPRYTRELSYQWIVFVSYWNLA